MCLEADFVQHPAHPITRAVLGVDQHDRHAFGARCVAALANHQHQASQVSVRDEGFGTPQDKARGSGLGTGTDGLQVRTGAGFGHGDGADHITSGQARQPVLFLGFGAVVE